MAYRAIGFDLDNTLYHPDTKFLDALLPKLFGFWQEKHKISSEEFHARDRVYKKIYGSGLKGFLVHTPELDLREFATLYRDEDYQQYLKPDEELQKILSEIDPHIKKYIVTNAPLIHTHKSLVALGVDHRVFDGIISLDTFGGKFCKPDIEVYQHMVQISGIPAHEWLFIDDTLENLPPAQQLGMRTVHISPSPPVAHTGTAEKATYQFPRVHHIKKIHGLSGAWSLTTHHPV
jgi:putative hydrolase of the HAD superfamily